MGGTLEHAMHTPALGQPAARRLPDVQREVAAAAVVDGEVEVLPRLEGAVQLHHERVPHAREDVALRARRAHHLVAAAPARGGRRWSSPSLGSFAPAAARAVNQPQLLPHARRRRRHTCIDDV